MSHHPNQPPTAAFIVEAELADMYEAHARDNRDVQAKVYRLDDPDERSQGFSALQLLPAHSQPTFTDKTIMDRLAGEDMAVLELRISNGAAHAFNKAVKPHIMARKAVLDAERHKKDGSK
jgi:hypothetical protein